MAFTSQSQAAWSGLHTRNSHFSHQLHNTVLPPGYINRGNPQAPPWSPNHPRTPQYTQASVIEAPHSDPQLFNYHLTDRTNYPGLYTPNVNYSSPTGQYSMDDTTPPANMQYQTPTQPVYQSTNNQYSNALVVSQYSTAPQQYPAPLTQHPIQYSQELDYLNMTQSSLSPSSELDTLDPFEGLDEQRFHNLQQVTPRPVQSTSSALVPSKQTGRSKQNKSTKMKKTGKAYGPYELPVRGGRQLGSHLDPEKAAQTNVVRKMGSCWPCKFQRDACGTGDPCTRCVKRGLKGGIDLIYIECRRDSLPDLGEAFMPAAITNLFRPEAFNDMVNKAVAGWQNEEHWVSFSCGAGIPPLRALVYEFIPIGADNEILRQTQFSIDKDTKKSVRTTVYSPPLGMTGVDFLAYEVKCDEWVNALLDNPAAMNTFANRFCAREVDSFPKSLVKLVIDAMRRRETSSKRDGLRDLSYLMVTSYVLSHSFTIEDAEKSALAAKLSWKASEWPKFTSPRLVNRQMKIVFCNMQTKKLRAVLQGIQQVLTNSKGGEQYSTNFLYLLGAGISIEYLQKYVHTIHETAMTKNEISEYEANHRSVTQVAEMDRQYGFLVALFNRKYPPTSDSSNPLMNPNLDWSKRIKDARFITFLLKLRDIVIGKQSYLVERATMAPSTLFWRQYTNRLSGAFLRSFFQNTAVAVA